MFLMEQVFDVPLGVRLLNKIPCIKRMPYNWKHYWYDYIIIISNLSLHLFMFCLFW